MDQEMSTGPKPMLYNYDIRKISCIFKDKRFTSIINCVQTYTVHIKTCIRYTTKGVVRWVAMNQFRDNKTRPYSTQFQRQCKAGEPYTQHNQQNSIKNKSYHNCYIMQQFMTFQDIRLLNYIYIYETRMLRFVPNVVCIIYIALFLFSYFYLDSF